MLRASQFLRSSAYLKGTKGASKGGGETKPEILVVTSDSATLGALGDSLREMGYGVADVRDRSQAEDYLNRQKPIMVICEVDLPADGAYHLFRSIKGTPDTTSIPCVFLTNRGEFPDKKLGFESGADDYITKPLESTEIRARIEPLLRRGKIVKREEFSREERKPPREVAEPKDILSEILAREKTAEESDEGKARFSSMDLIKNQLKDKEKKEAKVVGRAEAKEKEKDVTLEQTETVYQDSVKAVTEWMDLVGQEDLVDIAEVEKISGNLLEKVNSNSLLLNMMSESEEEESLADRSVSTAILSLKMGKRLGYPDRKLTQLGVAALLHLVGLRKLVEGAGQRAETSEGEEQQYTKEYPSIGAELLRTSVERYGGQEYSWLPEAVSQVEEREDGRGVPRGLKGNQIHEYAKVIAVAKRYLDFIRPLFTAEKIIPCDAIKKIIEMQKDALSPVIVSIFVKEMGIFPVGSWIHLSNGEIGMVVSNYNSQPLRPTVEVLYGPEGTPLLDKRKLNLVENPFIFISKPIDENKIIKKEIEEGI